MSNKNANGKNFLAEVRVCVRAHACRRQREKEDTVGYASTERDRDDKRGDWLSVFLSTLSSLCCWESRAFAPPASTSLAGLPCVLDQPHVCLEHGRAKPVAAVTRRERTRQGSGHATFFLLCFFVGAASRKKQSRRKQLFSQKKKKNSTLTPPPSTLSLETPLQISSRSWPSPSSAPATSSNGL